MSVEINYSETKIRPVFGGRKIEAIYNMKHTKHNHTNVYEITCEIVGIQSHDPHLATESAKFIGKNSNEETLTEDAAIDLFNEYIS